MASEGEGKGGGCGGGSGASPGPPSFPRRPCANPGNPVFSCLLDARALATGPRLSAPQPQPQPLLYKTTSGEYGALRPTAATAPCRYCPRDHAFSARLSAAGPPQFNGINTGGAGQRPFGAPELVNTL